MNKFDKVLEEMNKTRTTTRRERYPANIDLSPEFLEILDREYGDHYVEGNRNIHSNFLKAISFEIDKIRDKKKHETPMEIQTIEIDADEIPESPLEAIIPEV